jgi:hypothetical protein
LSEMKLFKRCARLEDKVRHDAYLDDLRALSPRSPTRCFYWVTTSESLMLIVFAIFCLFSTFLLAYSFLQGHSRNNTGAKKEHEPRRESRRPEALIPA